ncbi:hypothetical protein ACNPAA_20955, partial [Aeromonas sp. PS2Canimalfood6]|uniref:hypothetical protein n=1 Tax=Aeromonas sp. PS2Canimalfood6 TaxID=3397770 RepID=UPI003AA81E78
QARFSSWRGEHSPSRRRIDLSKPTTTPEIKVAKKGVTIDFVLGMTVPAALFLLVGGIRDGH